jgi:hypothetical protein
MTDELDHSDDGLAEVLARWPAPRPIAAQTRALVAALTTELPTPTRLGRVRAGWALLRAQLQIVGREIWAASAVVMGFGLLVTLAAPARADALPFLLIAPLANALAISFVYGVADSPAEELERAAPVSPRLVLLARLLPLFAFNLALGVAMSVILRLAGVDTPLPLLIGLWLAPMTLLSALAFACAVLTGSASASIAVCLGLWATQIIRQTVGADDPPALIVLLPDLSSTMALPRLYPLAFVLLLLGLWIVGRHERPFRQGGVR